MSRSKDQDFLDRLADHLRSEQSGDVAPQTNGHSRRRLAASPVSTGPTDEMVIEKCRGARNAEKFADLFDRGDVRRYHGGDESAADLGLLGT